MNGVCEPKYIAGTVSRYIHDGFPDGNLNLFNLIEDENALFLVKTMQVHNLIE
jgi:hypothetical protein